MAGDRALNLYQHLLGVDPALLPAAGAEAGPSLADVVYYAYQRGFWPYLRGLLQRPGLKSCGGRFFVGRSSRILFPNRLSVGRNVALGDHVYLNCYSSQGVSLADNVRIREFGWVQVSSHLSNPGRGVSIGANTFIGPHCVLGAGGGITIGADVAVGAYCQLLAENHSFEERALPINRQGVTRRGIKIEDGCWLGNNTMILDGVRVGRGSVVGAGSVVTRDVAAHTVVAGNPARVLRSL
jgi:acetyltransferase-like isoleucine patch superfamily enzyme